MTEKSLEGALIAFCNPLLDITATVDQDFLSKYDLKENDAILAAGNHVDLFTELVQKFDVTYSAGGAGQNTTRAAQWLLPKGSTVYIGCVGKDANGQILREAAQSDGLVVEYLEDEEAPTGTCAVLLNGKNRSLVARLGAANNYKGDHLLQEALQAHIDRSQLIYITGFFLTVSPETIIHLANIAHEHNKLFTMNLSAPFLSHAFRKPMLETLPYVDFLFGNEAEAVAFAEANDIETRDIEEIAQKLANWERASETKVRTVIITHGSEPTVVAVTHGTSVSEFPTPRIDPSEIIDTNGAGDAFVGGFLSSFVKGESLEDSIQMGHRLAGFIIRQSGVVFPKQRPAGFGI